MFCVRCGAANDDNDRFCTKCGSELPLSQTPAPPKEERPAIPVEEKTAVTQRSVLPEPVLPQQTDANRYGTSNTQPPYGTNPYSYPRVQQKPEPRNRTLVAAIAILAVAAIVAIAIVLDPLGLRSGDPTPNPQIQGEVVSGNGGNGPDDDVPHDYEGKSSNVGNLINGGHIAGGDDGMLYFADPVDGTNWDTRSIVRCSADGSNKTTVYTAPNSTQNVYHISVIGDKLVFNQVAEKASKVVVVGTDGSGATTLDSCDDWSLCMVDDGWVYYFKSGRICRCDMSGQNRASLASVGTSSLWRVQGKRLYSFAEKDARELMMSNLDGSGRSTLYSSPGGYTIKNAFPTESGQVLVWLSPQSGEGCKLLLVDPQTKQDNTFWTSAAGIERVCAYPEGAIITRADANGMYSIVSIPFSSGKEELDVTATSAGEARYTCYTLGSIYYGVIVDETQCSVHVQALEGGSSRVIAD